MKKRTLVVLGLILSFSLIATGSAFAHWRGGYGMMGWGNEQGPGDCYRAGVDSETMIKFQKETLPLRDGLLAKRLELSQEYNKETPDTDHIAQIRKGIIDIQAKIQKVADKYGLGYTRRGGEPVGRYGCEYGPHRGSF